MAGIIMMNENEITRKIKIDIDKVITAMDSSYFELNYYLNTETGSVVMVSYETRRQLVEIYEEAGGTANGQEEDEDIESLLKNLDIPDWQKDALRAANDVENNFGDRYISIPGADSNQGYEDMQEFADSLTDQRVRDRLLDALERQHPFRRFKDVLYNFTDIQQQWYQFKDHLQKARAIEWLKDEGLEMSVGE